MLFWLELLSCSAMATAAAIPNGATTQHLIALEKFICSILLALLEIGPLAKEAKALQLGRGHCKADGAPKRKMKIGRPLRGGRLSLFCRSSNECLNCQVDACPVSKADQKLKDI